MIGGIYGNTAVYGRGYGQYNIPQVTARTIPAAQTGKPVEPVRPVKAPTQLNAPAYGERFDKNEVMFRWEHDPVAWAARSRIQYPGAENAAGAKGTENAKNIPGMKDEDADKAEGLIDGEKSKSAQEVAEEGECQTCKRRKYQDGSDDPGVSFKTPTKIDPDMATAAVRGHEMEHVVRNQAEAKREGRKVVSQTVTYHTAICPECGRVYTSGGTTRTVTAADRNEPIENDKDGDSGDISKAVA